MAGPETITQGELDWALKLLQERPHGLPRADLERMFGSDRKGRAIMAALVERGIAAIITVPALGTRGEAYKIAKTVEEIEQEDRELQSRIARLEKRRRGLRLAAQAGGVRVEQGGLFE